MPKILYLTGYNFDRVDSGATVRSLNVFRLLARLGSVRVVLASAYDQELRDAEFPQSGIDLAAVVRLHPTGRVPLRDRLRHEFDGRFLDTFRYQAAANDIERLQALMADHDVVWIHGLGVANAFGLWRWPRSVLDIDDVPSCLNRTLMKQAAGVMQKITCYRQIQMWQRREKTLLERFETVCVCSEPDRDELRRLIGESDRIHVLPNGIATPEREPKRNPAVPPRIGFVGSPTFGPNRDGLRWFIQRVWPTILREVPLARLRLVGMGTETGYAESSKNIDGLGWVADVEREMATWSLMAVPILTGGGTRIKTAEALSRKCPVVSTSLGTFGYDVAGWKGSFYFRLPQGVCPEVSSALGGSVRRVSHGRRRLATIPEALDMGFLRGSGDRGSEHGAPFQNLSLRPRGAFGPLISRSQLNHSPAPAREDCSILPQTGLMLIRKQNFLTSRLPQFHSRPPRRAALLTPHH